LLAARIQERINSPAFRYRDYGNLATIGRKAAVVALGRLHFTVRLGSWFWGCIHIYFLIGLRNRFVVALQCLWH
jgi:NADH dehydrogenase